MPRGGYRQPMSPAPVSGPGALSRRTDGGPTQAAQRIGGGQYGERKQLAEQQAAAPMAGRQQVPAGRVQPNTVQRNQAPITLLTAPSERPNEPITAGLPFGAGPGPEALGTVRNTNKASSVLQKIVNNDPTGQVAELYEYLISRGL